MSKRSKKIEYTRPYKLRQNSKNDTKNAVNCNIVQKIPIEALATNVYCVILPPFCKKR